MVTERLSPTDDVPAELIDTLLAAGRTTVLTGAGVSAESGIPTFREAHTGLWARYDPMDLASPEAFERDPATVWDWYEWRRSLIAESRPNPGHEALAALGDRLARIDLITQNVDGFHSLAGSRNVLELHGNIQRNICSRTGEAIGADWIARHAGHRPPPSPHHADGLARPDVVWFGEALPETVLQAAFDAAERCELMIVAGTSGNVQPAASLPVVASRAGATVIDINPEPGALTALARWHLSGPSATWLPMLLEAIEARSD